MNLTKTKTVFVAVLGLLLITSLADAQSGSRIPSSSSGGSSGGSRGGGGGVSGSGFDNFPRSLTPQEGALRGYGDLVRGLGEANLRNAQATKELEIARTNYIDNQFRIEQYRRERRAEKERAILLAREQRAVRRSMERMAQREKSNSMWEMSWPAPLQKARYAAHRKEIKELSILHATLDRKRGVAIGLRESIKQLAKQIQEDEQANRLLETESQLVRTFVTELYQTNGQSGLMKKMDGMLADR